MPCDLFDASAGIIQQDEFLWLGGGDAILEAGSFRLLKYKNISSEKIHANSKILSSWYYLIHIFMMNEML